MVPFRGTNSNWHTGRAVFASPVSDFVNMLNLPAGAAKTIPVPEGAGFAVFSATDDIWVRYDDQPFPADMAVDITDGSAPDFNPTSRMIAGVTEINILAEAACQCVISFYGE